MLNTYHFLYTSDIKKTWNCMETQTCTNKYVQAGHEIQELAFWKLNMHICTVDTAQCKKKIYKTYILQNTDTQTNTETQGHAKRSHFANLNKDRQMFTSTVKNQHTYIY